MEQVRAWLQTAGSVAVLTGAGISAESGVPTFRGSGGLWKTYRPEELATLEAFQRDPRLVWDWYLWRRSKIREAQPNAGHASLVRLEDRVARFTLITQNVDGLHDRAGSRNVLPVHGDIWTVRCTICGSEYRDLRPEFPEVPPRCECRGLLRPGVVWFGEDLPQLTWRKAEEAAREAEVFLVIGTSAQVYPAAGLIALAKSAGARVIEINPDETPYSSRVDRSLRGPAGILLPQLVG